MFDFAKIPDFVFQTRGTKSDGGSYQQMAFTFVPKSRGERDFDSFANVSTNIRDTNYIRVQRDPSTPLLTARSNASYEDTPRGIPVHRSTANVVANQDLHLERKIDVDIVSQNMTKNEESALHHWLSDTKVVAAHVSSPAQASPNRPECGELPSA